MANLWRIRCTWTGAIGLPGVSTFYAPSLSTTAVAELVAYFEAVKALIPASVNIEVPSDGDIIDETTGTLAGVWSSPSGAVVDCTGSGVHASGVGARVVFNTAGIVRGRRVRGANFLAPLIVGVLDTDGTLTTGNQLIIRNAAIALAEDSDLVVWSRPSTPGGSDGTSHSMTGASVPDRVTALRSRRY